MGKKFLKCELGKEIDSDKVTKITVKFALNMNGTLSGWKFFQSSG